MAAQAQVPAAFAFIRSWVGNQRLFSNSFALGLEEKSAFFKKINDGESGTPLKFDLLVLTMSTISPVVTYMAPMWKWVLSIVPLSQALVGKPPVENIDLKQSGALMSTGVVWAYYSTLIQPQNAGSRALMLCNLAMGSTHGFNVFRKFRHEQAKAKEESA
eukprot:Colp12_sorted_trinity150504_noHs@16959